MSKQKVGLYRLHFGGQNGFPPPWRAVIHLFKSANHAIGKIFFVEREKIPQDQEKDSEGLSIMFLSAQYYQGVVDLLRNETPVFFEYNSGLERALLYTDREGTGEGEKSTARR